MGAPRKTFAVLLPLAMAACASVAGSPLEHRLGGYDEVWVRTQLASDAYRAYTGLPHAAPELQQLPAATLAQFAMLESTRPAPDWQRILAVARRHPDLEAGLAVLNFLERFPNPTWSASWFEALGNTPTTPGFDACIFAHLRDEASIPSAWNPLHWIEDTFGYHRNHFTNCGWFLAARSQPRMQREWQRLATFRRNPELRGLGRSLGGTEAPTAEADAFSALVDTVRTFRAELLQWSAAVTDGLRPQ